MPVIGVALSIPEPWASELQDYRTTIDPSAAMIPTHITLVPPTVIDDADLTAVEEHLAKVAEADRALRRAPARHRHLPAGLAGRLRQPGQGDLQTEQLAAAVRSGPLGIDVEFPFHPHVTVAHHLPDDQMDRAFDDLAAFDCSFAVASFHLYVHDEAEGWRPTRDFTLQKVDGAG